jgi:hypothetical protein
MAKNREGSINLFGAVQAKTENGIVAHADGIAVEYDENGNPTKTLAQAIEDGSIGGGGSAQTPKLSLLWDELFDLSSTKEKFNNIDFTEELYNQAKSANKLEVEISNSTNDIKINLILQTTQIEEQDEMIRLGLTTDKYFIEVGLQLLDNETSGHILFQFRETLGVIDVEKLPSPIIDTSTAVPSSGYVGKVYFNTKLSIDEVNEILGSLEYVEGVLSLPAVAIATTVDMSQGIVIMGIIEESGSAFIITTGDGQNIYEYDSGDTNEKGWVLSEYELNIDNMLSLLAPQVGMTIQNDKLKNLISATPFEAPNPDIELDKLYRTPVKGGGEWEGTVVPNSGTVEKIYLNTSLSDEEVANILSKLTYDDEGVYYSVATTDNFIMAVIHMNGTNGYALGNMNTGEMYWANQEVIEIMQAPLSAGWQNFTNPIEINGIFDTTSTAGEQNDKLHSLVSTTPFVQTGEVTGYKYHQLVNGEWKELGSGGEVELPKDLPVVIEKTGALFTDVSFTNDDWELILNNKIVIINVKNMVENIVLTDSLYTKQIFNAIDLTVYFIGYHADGTAYRYAVTKDTTDGSIKINKVFEEVNYIAFRESPDYIGLQVYGGNPNNNSLQTIWKATTITSDSNSLATSKAVYDFVTNYMKTNYGNGNEEKF